MAVKRVEAHDAKRRELNRSPGEERPRRAIVRRASPEGASVSGKARAAGRLDVKDENDPGGEFDSGVRRAASGPFKLLAIDLDGTLLDHKGEPNAADVAAIRRLMARGVRVTIVTGRLYSGARPTAEMLGITEPVACADGSHIVRVQDTKTMLHRGIRGRAAARLRASVERNELVAFLFAEDAIIHDERGADYLPYVRSWSTDLRYVHRVTEHALWDSESGMTAVVGLGREVNIGQTVADIQRDASEAMQVGMFPFRRDVDDWGMVARASGGTKGTALAWLAAHHGIGISETVCVGDWLNDVPMLETAGRSFAMGQAPPEVKSAATDVLERTIETGGGIAEAIEKAFGTGS